MSVILTCVCGRQVGVDVGLAGQRLRCQACGNVLQVPVMGIVAGAPPLSPPPAPPVFSQPPPSRILPWLAAFGIILLTGAGIVLGVRALSRPADRAEALAPVASADFRAEEPPRQPERQQPGPIDRSAEQRIAPSSVPQKKLDLPVSTKPVDPQPPSPPPKPPAAKPKPKPKEVFGPGLHLVWKLREGDRLFQDLHVVQKPNFVVQGVPVATNLHYRVVSSFTVAKRDADKLTIHQKVESAELLQADPLTQGLIAPLVLKLAGTSFIVELDPAMEVTRFAGAADSAKMAGLNLPGLQGVQMTGLLDADGWKEMAQLTFFQPNRGLAQGDQWSRPLTHNWGTLGSWNGTTHYSYRGSKDALHQIDYALRLNYQMPKAGGLISKAVFRPMQAGGTIIFDRDKGRVVEARENFQVRGLVGINLLGQNTDVELQEDQVFTMRILERQP